MKQQDYIQGPERHVFEAITVLGKLGTPPQLVSATNALGECYLREYSDRAICIKAWFYSEETGRPYPIKGYDIIKIFITDNLLAKEELVLEWQAFTQPEILHYQYGSWEDYLGSVLLPRAVVKYTPPPQGR